MFWQQLINGLAIGSIYALVAVGYSLVYGVIKLINFANNAFMVGGSYLLILFFEKIGIPFWPSIFLSLIISGLGAIFMERASLNPIRKRQVSDIAALICTVGYSTVIVNIIMIVFGSQTISVPFIYQLKPFPLGNVVINPFLLLILAAALVMMGLLTYLTYFTKTGEAMRAISQNSVAAKLMGVNVNNIITLTFFIGTVCAGFAGIMIGWYAGAIDTGMSFSIGIKAFAAAILGGIGVLHGSLIGGLVIGILETFVAGYLTAGYRDAVAFVILIIVLIISPTGLFGKKILTKV